MKYYLVGIKGAAMSALANILYQLGHTVLGVDVEEDFYTFIKNEDIKIETFNNYQLSKDYFYIIGNAFKDYDIVKNIIINEYDYEYYPVFLNGLFNIDKIAVCGSHGKTTTTKLISHLLGDKCSSLIGDGTSFVSKKAEAFVFEACEYKNTFLNYYPQILLINNIDYDHPDFFKTKEDYFNSFNLLAMQSEMIVLNGDDNNCKKINVYNKITFGFNSDNDLVCKYKLNDNGYDLTLHYLDNTSSFYLPFFGKHMIYNFLGAFCVLRLLGIKDEVIQERLLSFTLPNRRGETKIVNNNYVICDYAHHPSEIKAFYEMIDLKYPNYKKIIIFQSHTYSRSKTFINEFKEALMLFDDRYLINIFSSVREKIDEKINDLFFDYLNIKHYDETIRDYLLKKTNCVICFVGAGNIDKEYNNFNINK